MYDNRIFTLLYSTFTRVSVVSYHTNLCWNSYTTNTIYLMVTFTIHAFEGVRTWLPCFGSYLVSFLVFHTTPCSFSVVFCRVSSIALGTSGDMRITVEC